MKKKKKTTTKIIDSGSAKKQWLHIYWPSQLIESISKNIMKNMVFWLFMIFDIIFSRYTLHAQVIGLLLFLTEVK